MSVWKGGFCSPPKEYSENKFKMKCYIHVQCFMELVLREKENEFQRSSFNPFTPTNCLLQIVSHKLSPTNCLPQIVSHKLSQIVILLILCIEILMVWRNCYLNQLTITLLIFLFILTNGLFDTVGGNSVLVTCGN